MSNENQTLLVSVSPHVRDNTTTGKIMLDVLIALFPALFASVVILVSVRLSSRSCAYYLPSPPNTFSRKPSKNP